MPSSTTAASLQLSRNVLGVPLGASPDEIRAVYKRRVLETHPDKGGNVDQFRRVQQAYETLIAGGGSGAPGLFSAARAPPPPASAAPRGSAPPPRGFASAGARSSLFTDGDVYNPFDFSVPLAARASRRRKPRTMEEEINCAFSSIPRAPATASQGSRRVNVALAQPALSDDKDTFISQLWTSLTSLTAVDREETIAAFDSGTKARLTEFLQARRSARRGGGGGSSRGGTGAAEAAAGGGEASAPRPPTPAAESGGGSVASVAAQDGSGSSSSSSSSSSSDSGSSSDAGVASTAPTRRRCSSKRPEEGPLSKKRAVADPYAGGAFSKKRAVVDPYGGCA